MLPLKTHILTSDLSSDTHTADKTVSIYPIDDKSTGLKEVDITSRQLIDIFVKKHDSSTFNDALLRSLARRLTAKTGGETAQNIRLLYLIDRILLGHTVDYPSWLFEEDRYRAV